MTSIDDVIASTVHKAWELAEKGIVEHGSIPFTVLFGYEDNVIDGPPIGSLSKDDYAFVLKLASQILRPRFAIRISEAWSLTSVTREQAQKAAEVGLADNPDLFPDRVEVVTINWKREGAEGMEVRRIDRDADGNPTIGAEIQYPKSGAQTRDRFFDHMVFG